MQTEAVYQWSWVAQGVTVAVDVETDDGAAAVSYRATPYPLGGEFVPARGSLRVLRDRNPRADGRRFDTALVGNLAAFQPCAIDLHAVLEAA